MAARDDFWRRWSPWRHGEPGAGNFADVMRVLKLYETFSSWAAERLGGAGEVTVLDLGCGATQLAGPLDEALRARGRALHRYLGVDFADPVWMPERAAREFSRSGIGARGEYLHHDLSAGLPPDLASRLGTTGELLVTSCWGITYLPPPSLVSLLREVAVLAAGWPGGTGGVLYVNLMSAGQFDREVLTRRFLGEVVPAHLWAAARSFNRRPLREIQLALKALPKMREFGAEVRDIAGLMPLGTFLDLLREAGHQPSAVDGSALWGQTTSIAVTLPAK